MNTTVASKPARRDPVSTAVTTNSPTPASDGEAGVDDVRHVGRLGKAGDARGQVNASGQQRIARRVRNSAQVAEGLKVAPVAPRRHGERR